MEYIIEVAVECIHCDLLKRNHYEYGWINLKKKHLKILSEETMSTYIESQLEKISSIRKFKGGMQTKFGDGDIIVYTYNERTRLELIYFKIVGTKITQFIEWGDEIKRIEQEEAEWKKHLSNKLYNES